MQTVSDYSSAGLKKQWKILERYSKKIRPFLPPEWRHFCYVVRYDLTEQHMVLSVSEQECLTLLRFMQPQLLKKCRQDPLFKPLKTLECIFSPLPFTPSEKPPPASIKMHTSTVQFLKEMAETCSTPVKTALKKLAKTLNVGCCP